MTKKNPQAKPISLRSRVLLTAEELTSGDRNDSYNDPKINMMAFEELLAWAKKWQEQRPDDAGSGHDAAMVMVYAKIARIVVGAAKDDNYIDAAAYLAMAWECHLRVLGEDD